MLAHILGTAGSDLMSHHELHRAASNHDTSISIILCNLHIPLLVTYINIGVIILLYHSIDDVLLSNYAFISCARLLVLLDSSFSTGCCFSFLFLIELLSSRQ